jgi:hypothetical protein
VTSLTRSLASSKASMVRGLVMFNASNWIVIKDLVLSYHKMKAVLKK